MRLTYTLPVLTAEQARALAGRLGAFIKQEREDRRRWSQQRLAAQSGVNQPLISRIENGTQPDVDTLWRIADGFGWTPAEFFTAFAQSVTEIESGQTKSDYQQPLKAGKRVASSIHRAASSDGHTLPRTHEELARLASEAVSDALADAATLVRQRVFDPAGATRRPAGPHRTVEPVVPRKPKHSPRSR